VIIVEQNLVGMLVVMLCYVFCHQLGIHMIHHGVISTKPECNNIWQFCQRRTEPKAACAKHLV